MVLEIAVLDIKQGLEKQFELAFEKAQAIISDIPGYSSHQLQNCPQTQLECLGCPVMRG